MYGCTDSRANNFNPAATYDDGSCEYDDYYGCTDPVATNFDPNALVNDGSCEYPDNYGCTDPTATNFDPNALINDGSCEYNHVYGCTDPKANNFDPNATYDDGSCEYDEEFPKCGHFPKPLCAEPGKNAACAKGKWVDVPDDKDANGNTTKFIWACTTGAVENEDDNENDYPAHVSQNYEDYEQDNSDTEGYSILCEADVDKNCINRPEDFRMNMVHECSDPSIEMKITQLKTISDPTVLTLNLSIEEIDMRNAVVNTMTIPLANQPKFNADGEAIFGLEYIDTTKFNYVT